MGLEFKEDIIVLLNRKKWDQKRIREESKIGTRTYYDLRKNKVPGTKGIEELCRMLEMQPGSFLKYVSENNKKIE